MQYFNFSEKLKELDAQAIKLCSESFLRYERVRDTLSEKVLRAFIDHKVADYHLLGTTGYGYGDLGRDVIDRIYAQVMDAEDALVRHNFVNGTHAIATALFGVLRSGDKVLCALGRPYDTLEEVFGLRGQDQGSLLDFGVETITAGLLPDGTADREEIKRLLPGVKAVYFQRSRGYTLRPSVNVEELGSLIAMAKEENPEVLCIVDNCYGEFVEEREPTAVGADLVVGSLIKNPGGGVAKTGGYIAGRSDLIEKCSYRLTTPGTGREVGATGEHNRDILFGLFSAPGAVCEAKKTACYTSALFEIMGYETLPKWSDKKTDIITSVLLESPENLISFCRGIQAGSPVDSFATPEPWDMPGYDDQVIMAAGTFVQGSSLELSADGPLREPYAVWVQGGLQFAAAKIGILTAAGEVMKNR